MTETTLRPFKWHYILRVVQYLPKKINNSNVCQRIERKCTQTLSLKIQLKKKRNTG